ncbi:MAG: lipopolysaccharide heptosyltransferase II [Planctomycetota bacterium]
MPTAPPARFERIWVRLPNWVGDIVMATPVLRALRATWPGARIAWCGRPIAHAVLRATPWYDEFIPHPRHSGMGGFWSAAKAARAFGPELAVVLPHSFGTALLARATGAKQRIGHLTEGRGFLLTGGIPRPRENGRTLPEYMADHWAKLVAVCGVEVADLAPELVVAPESQAKADELLAAHPAGSDGPLIVLNPGASYGPSKMWPAERFAAVASALRESHGARIVVSTGPGEEAVAEAVDAALDGPVQLYRGTELPLDLLIATVKRAAVLLTNDTGPRHFAVAQGIRTVVLMGSTDPRYTFTPAEQGVVIRRDVECGPCHETVCPLQGDEHHQCLRMIEPPEVIQQVQRALDAAIFPEP